MSLRRSVILLVVLLTVAGGAFLRLRGNGQEPVRRSRILMGTVVEITAFGGDRDRTEAAVGDAFEEMGRIERLMGPAGEESDVVRLSRSAAAEVSPETAEVIALGLEVGKASGGKFDMTLGRLKALWGVETESPRIPAPQEIREALQGTGEGALRVDGRRVEKGTPGLVLDLGGIAKGYALDRAAAILRREGVEAAAVNAGGDIVLIGDRRGRPWRIGIQHPRDPEKVLATLELQDRVIVTSGDYERYFERDGVRYHHLFDPATGYPASLCRSVTVVAGSAARADALATAAFVLGPEEGLRLLADTPGVEGLIVDADGKHHLTAGLEGKIRWP